MNQMNLMINPIFIYLGLVGLSFILLVIFNKSSYCWEKVKLPFGLVLSLTGVLVPLTYILFFILDFLTRIETKFEIFTIVSGIIDEKFTKLNNWFTHSKARLEIEVGKKYVDSVFSKEPITIIKKKYSTYYGDNGEKYSFDGISKYRNSLVSEYKEK